MCGRFNVIDNPGLQALLSDLGIDLALPSAVNIAPTDRVGLVRQVDGVNEVSFARWWLTPSWAKQVDQRYAMFNARSETLASRAAFRTPFRRQRGIVPMSSFIEWRADGGKKQPFLVTSSTGAMAAAALWDVWPGADEPLLSCTVVTTRSAGGFEPYHTRMPVILGPDEAARWLDNSQAIAGDDPLFRPVLKTPWNVVPLSPAVGNAKNKEEALLEAVADGVVLKRET